MTVDDVTRAPQWPQKGRPGSTSLAHRGQCSVATVDTTPVNAIAGALPAAGSRPGALARALSEAGELLGQSGTTGADAADSALPQSMQKREAESFSRPQKEQAVVELTAGREVPWSANIREAKQGRQQRTALD